MWRSGDFCDDDRQTDRQTKPIALPLAHVCRVATSEVGFESLPAPDPLDGYIGSSLKSELPHFGGAFSALACYNMVGKG